MITLVLILIYLFICFFKLELLGFLEILKIEVPVIFNNLIATLKKTELFKMCNGLVKEIINLFPVEIFTKIWTIVNNWVMKIWMVYEADVIALLNNVHIGKHIMI